VKHFSYNLGRQLTKYAADNQNTTSAPSSAAIAFPSMEELKVRLEQMQKARQLAAQSTKNELIHPGATTRNTLLGSLPGAIIAAIISKGHLSGEAGTWPFIRNLLSGGAITGGASGAYTYGHNRGVSSGIDQFVGLNQDKK